MCFVISVLAGRKWNGTGTDGGKWAITAVPLTGPEREKLGVWRPQTSTGTIAVHNILVYSLLLFRTNVRTNQNEWKFFSDEISSLRLEKESLQEELDSTRDKARSMLLEQGEQMAQASNDVMLLNHRVCCLMSILKESLTSKVPMLYYTCHNLNAVNYWKFNFCFYF